MFQERRSSTIELFARCLSHSSMRAGERLNPTTAAAGGCLVTMAYGLVEVGDAEFV